MRALSDVREGLEKSFRLTGFRGKAMGNKSKITVVLQRLESGDGEAAHDLFPMVYDELRRLAKWKLSDERSDHTLQATALVNEVYIRLIGNRQDLAFDSRKCFFVAASEAMRHILVDAARRKMTRKRGCAVKREQLELDAVHIERPSEILDVHAALDALREHDPACGELVILHYFGGYSLAEVAELLNISRSTANRWWIYAKAFLKSELQ